MLQQKLNIDNTKDKINFLNEVAKILSQVDNKIEQEVYIEKISKQYNISKEAIYAETNKTNTKQENNTKTIINKIENVNNKTDNKKDLETNEVIAERENIILEILINNPEEYYKKIKDVIKQEDFIIKENKIILQTIYEKLEKDNNNFNNLNSNKFVDMFSENQEIINILTGIMAKENIEKEEYEKILENILLIYKKEKLIRRKNDIIESLSSNKKLENAQELEKELQHIIIRISKMK